MALIYYYYSPRTHPDRLFNASVEEKKVATEKFQVSSPLLWVHRPDTYGDAPQAVADAYYVLSDPLRRRDYDKLSSSRSSSERTSDPNASTNFFTTFASMFSSGASNGQTGTGTEQPGQRPNADRVFGDVFEDVRSLFPFLHPSPSSPIFLHCFFPPPNGRREVRRLLTLLFRPYPSFYGPRLSGISRCGRGWAQHAVQA